jgi:hypothetical protein
MEPRADVIEEAVRIVDAATAAHTTLRLLGGVAVALHAPHGVPEPLTRPYADIDLVTTKSGGPAVIRVLKGLGYEPNDRFNALNGHRRLVAYERVSGRRIDIFVGEFRMCHVIPVAGRLEIESRTIPLAELLATKLQIVELNDKDVKDILALFVDHEVGDHDSETINGAWLAELLSNDWGLWRTATGTAASVRDQLETSRLDPVAQKRIADRIGVLLSLIEQAPKSLRWRARARLGTRAKWYDEPEEIGHATTAG